MSIATFASGLHTVFWPFSHNSDRKLTKLGNLHSAKVNKTRNEIVMPKHILGNEIFSSFISDGKFKFVFPKYFLVSQ